MLAVLLTAGLLLVQWHWMQESYGREERTFHLRATTALHHAAGDVARMAGTGGRPDIARITQPAPGLYLMPVDTAVPQASMRQFLARALDEENLPAGFEYALYRGRSLQYHGVDAGTGDTLLPTAAFQGLPLRDGAAYAVALFFPHHTAAIRTGMRGWGLATLGVLAVLILFGYFLYLAFEQRRLQEIQKDFIMNMTHEFKTPLSSIRLAADVLKNPSILQSPQRLVNYATIIAEESAQLTAQVDRVLQVTRVEEGAIEMQQEPLVWQDVLQLASAGYKQTVEEKAGRLQLHLPDQPVRFTGDARHLQAAVGNLVDNALKYCTEAPEIHIFLKNFRRNIRVTVQDNGIGIDRRHQKMLFRRFYRVPTGNIHNVRGYGLGLNYVRIIAGAHGGTVECHSKPGAGASFTMVFPG